MADNSKMPAAEPVGDLLRIEEILEDRKHTHGNFSDHARCTQRLKNIIKNELDLRRARNQFDLSDQQQEAIDMIIHKIGRIVAGDPDVQDHWDDIAGYANVANKVF